MALTKIGSIGINTGIQLAGVTTLSTLNASNNVLSVGGTVNFTGNVSIAGTLTYEDVTNVDSVGLITARDGIVVGSGITLSKDGDIFFTGIITGNGSGLTGVANTDVIFPDKISLGDGTATSGDQINIGVGSDLKLFHNGTHSFISNGTGDLKIDSDDIKIRQSNSSAFIKCQNTAVELHFNDNKKLETTNTGVTVTGTVAATSYTGDGSNLTGVGITTEAASISGITTYLDLTKDDHELVVTGNNTISVIGGAQGTSHTLRLQNSGIATVTLDSTYFKFASGASPAFPTASGSISLVSFTVHKAGAVGVNTVLLTGASVNFS